MSLILHPSVRCLAFSIASPSRLPQSWCTGARRSPVPAAANCSETQVLRIRPSRACSMAAAPPSSESPSSSPRTSGPPPSSSSPSSSPSPNGSSRQPSSTPQADYNDPRKPSINPKLQARAASTAPAHPQTFRNLSWAEVETLSIRVAQKAKPYNFDLLLAITRGGLVPTALLSESLQLRTVLSTTVMFYTDAGEPFFGMTEPRFLSFPPIEALRGRRVLVVDDVWDSGRTAAAVLERVRRAGPAICHVAVLHFKPEAAVGVQRPDFYGDVASDWIVYPWEQCSPDAPVVPAEDGAMTGPSGNGEQG